MLRFDIHQLTDGRTVATCGTSTSTGQDPCRAIARDLVEAGAEDQPWEIWRGAMKSMIGKSLHWLAATAISETDAGLKLSWWSMHPHAKEPRPILTDLVARLKAEKAAQEPVKLRRTTRKR